MSLPRITPRRPPRAVRAEADPYRFAPPELRGIAPIRRLAHEDGSATLLAGNREVLSARLDTRRPRLRGLPTALPDAAGASIPLAGVGPEEWQWLTESMRPAR